MKNIAALLFLLIIITGCDDGDIIVTEFDFDDATVEACLDIEYEYVFFKINDSNEALALRFTTTEPILTEEYDDDFALSDDDEIVYRRFSEEVSSDYFCNSIPPTTPVAQEELVSDVGDISIRTLGEFTDSDGIPSEVEDPDGYDGDVVNMLDTDLDDLPDIIDFDDDGDNVPTSQEGVVLNDDETAIESARDTDGDGIPDYLDPDDDGDGILTINEDANGNLNPADDNSDPDNPTRDDYLNEDIAIENIITEYREHTYSFTGITVIISADNLIFINEDGSEETRIQGEQSIGTFSAPDATITDTPDFN